MRHLMLREQLHQFRDRLLAGEFRNPLVHQTTMVAPLLDGVEARIPDPVLHAQRLADAFPEAVRQAGDDDRSVLRRKDAVRHEVGMLRALRLRIFAGEERQLRQIAEHADQPVEQADIDQASATGDAALVQRREDADRTIDPADQVAQRNAQLCRRADRARH